jgi:glycosyltransferase involved in cell wall biosynthesis
VSGPFRRIARALIPRPLAAFLRRTFPSLADGRPSLSALRRRSVPPSERPSEYDVIVLPIIDWFFLFQRPQQLALRFAGDGRRVFYLDKDSLRDGPFARPDGDPEAIWVERNVALVSRLASRSLDVYTDTLNDSITAEIAASLEALRRRLSIDEAVLLVQLPFWAPLAQDLRNRFGWSIVYDCMDEHAGFQTNAEAMLSFEEQLIREADLVVPTSRYLEEKVCPSSRRCLTVPNAADFEHFHRARDPLPVEKAVEALPSPIIGYYGSISSWFDADVVLHAARARPHWSFLLIGADFDVDATWRRRPPNVHFLGRKPYQDIPAYLSRFDVCCIPFKISPLTIASNPVKFFEYISAGKPVVSTRLPELEPYSEHVHFADTPETFLQAIEQALAEDSAARTESRIALARANTWETRHRLLDEAFRSLLSGDRPPPAQGGQPPAAHS